MANELDEFEIGYNGPGNGVEVAGGFLADADASLVTQSGALKVVTPAGTKYIPLYNAAA